MKKEFSFYEFVGLIVPGALFLYGTNFVLGQVFHRVYIDFSALGETLIFLIVCYGVGHLIQAGGNIYENVVWAMYKGMPSTWLLNPNIFGKKLFDGSYNQRVVDKVVHKFGAGLNDYTRLVYNHLYLSGKTERIDIFNGNYSLFRGLAIAFLLLAILCCYYFDWTVAVPAFIPFVLCTRRMIRFAKYYASETYTTFFNS